MKKMYFIKWCWSKFVAYVKSWDRWMWGWLVTCAWGPDAVTERATNPNSFYCFMIFALVFWVGYGVIYTGIKRLYQKFVDEQERIVDHLKNAG